MEFSERFKFSDWPNKKIPSVSAGVYAIWKGSELFYCGMSGTNIERAIQQGKQKYGLITRLNSHAKGRLGGDQFCVYVANRLVIPDLSPHDLPNFKNGKLDLDTLTRKYICDHLEYQYIIVDSSKEARSIEEKARRGEVFEVRPLLNPINA